MATYQYNILLVPESEALHTMCFPLDEDFDFWDNDWWDKSLAFNLVEPALSASLPAIEWSKESKDIYEFGNNETNDISICLIDELYIENFHVRIDLRELDHKFIDLILKIAKENECLLLDRKGLLFDPSLEKIKASMQKSNAFKFVSDPSDFLSGISSGEIELE